TGSEFRNNIFTKAAEIGSAARQSNNITAGTEAMFVNPSGNDYQLKDGSPAIDAGVVLAPYTDGYAGARPDAGAFEFGRPQWAGGAATGVSVDLTWLALADAASYRVERLGPRDAKFIEIARGVVPAAYHVQALRPGATYKFRVRGENSRGVSSRNSTVTVTTPA